MIVYLIGFAALLLWRMKKVPGGGNNDCILTKSNTLSLKGICAIEIMLGHIGGVTGNIFLYPFRKAGILIVGVFFLFSGYGLMKNTAERPGYLNGFLRKRCLLIILPALFAYLFYIAVTFAVDGPEKLMGFRLFAGFFTHTNWYVFELLGFYVAFFLLYRYIPRQADRILAAGSILFIMIAHFMHFSAPWYGSSLCFPLGVLVAKHGGNWMERIRPVACLAGTFLGIGLFYACGRSVMGNLIGRNLASFLFCNFAVYLCIHYNIGNKITYFLGKISYEIFLLHGFFFYWLNGIGSHTLFTAGVIGYTLVSAWLLYLADEKVRRRIRGKLT